MKRMTTIMLMCIVALPLLANDVVKSVRGTVEVRRGVSEEWKPVRAGELLRPEDTMRTGKKSTAVLVVGARQYTVPEMTMVDVADFRQLTEEEFFLKLAMENILAVPPRKNQQLSIPSTSVMRGADRGGEVSASAVNDEYGIMQIRGAKLLYDNAFYATSVLKTKETLRLFPSLKSNIDARIRTAQAFERMKLTKEATTEYALLLAEKLPASKRQRVQTALDRLRKAK